MTELTSVAGMKGIVVGTDGSACSLDAVRWALGQAALQACPLQVITTWQIISHIAPKEGVPQFPVDLCEYERFVRQRLHDDVDPIVAERSDVKVELHVVHAAAADALIAASRKADLVVIGSRGLGGFLALALGSVADQVMRHAYCPVVVVRDASNHDTDVSH